MTRHLDLLIDVGPEGPRTPAAERHLGQCRDCRERWKLLQLIRDAVAAPEVATSAPGHAAQGTCPAIEDLVSFAADGGKRTGRARSVASVRRHVASCADCTRAVEAARRELQEDAAERTPGAVSLPPALRVRFAPSAETLPWAAAPRDITRPSPAPLPSAAPRRAVRRPRKRHRGPRPG